MALLKYRLFYVINNGTATWDNPYFSLKMGILKQLYTKTTEFVQSKPYDIPKRFERLTHGDVHYIFLDYSHPEEVYLEKLIELIEHQLKEYEKIAYGNYSSAIEIMNKLLMANKELKYEAVTLYIAPGLPGMYCQFALSLELENIENIFSIAEDMQRYKDCIKFRKNEAIINYHQIILQHSSEVNKHE